MKKSKLVSIIIVNWNGKKYLQACLSSLYKQEFTKIEVILVDNASSDGSVEYIRQKFPRVKIIVNKENIGFAEANNIGYRGSRGEYVLFLNNDTKVTKKFLIELVNALETDESVGGAQSKILLLDEKDKLDAVGSFLTSTGFLYHYGFAKSNIRKYGRKINIYSAKGAAMIFKRGILEKIKVDGDIFDRGYFAYFEETDMCHRVWLSGYRIIFVPRSIIYHKIGATSSRLNNTFIHYHSFKNRINSYTKNLGPQGLVRILSVHLAICIFVSVIYALKGQVGMGVAVGKAILWNLSNLGQTLRYRWYVQTHVRKLEDKIFLPIITKPVKLSYYYYLFFGNLKNYAD